MSAGMIALIAAAGVAFAGALVYAFWPTPARKPPPPAARTSAGRNLIDVMDEVGKDHAARLIESKLGQHKAKQIMGSLAEAFADSPASPK